MQNPLILIPNLSNLECKR